MADQNTIKGKALRDFRDAGIEKSFTEGKVYEFGEGAFANYEHAGLVETADEATEVAHPILSPAPRSDEEA